MRVVKFCSSAHNPLLGGAELQLCALSSYRETDQQFIRDSGEGLIGHAFSPGETTVFTGDDLGRAFDAGIAGNGTVAFSGNAAIKLVAPLPDAYILCTSRDSSDCPATAASFGYDSWYAISNLDGFVAQLAAEIERLLPVGTRIAWFHGPVTYHEEKTLHFSHLEALAASRANFNPALYFMKQRTSDESDRVFQDESEYRFVFLPVDAASRVVRLPVPCLRVDVAGLLPFIGEVEAPDKRFQLTRHGVGYEERS